MSRPAQSQALLRVTLVGIAWAWSCSPTEAVLRNGEVNEAGDPNGGVAGSGGNGDGTPGAGGSVGIDASGSSDVRTQDGGAVAAGSGLAGANGDASAGGAGPMGADAGAAGEGVGGAAGSGAGGRPATGGAGGRGDDPIPVAGSQPDCLDESPRDSRISLFSNAMADAPSLEVLGLEGRLPGGRWQLVTDGTGAATLNALAVVPPRCGSGFALQFKGGGFTRWGALVQSFFGRRMPADVSAYRGLRFSLRASQPIVVRLKVPDRNSLASAGVCTKCDDHFGRNLQVTREWTEFKIPFSDLRQEGTGVPQSMAFDPKSFYGVEFYVRQGLTFELWVDDVSLLP